MGKRQNPDKKISTGLKLERGRLSSFLCQSLGLGHSYIIKKVLNIDIFDTVGCNACREKKVFV